jgi:hypothetical protein
VDGVSDNDLSVAVGSFLEGCLPAGFVANGVAAGFKHGLVSSVCGASQALAVNERYPTGGNYRCQDTNYEYDYYQFYDGKAAILYRQILRPRQPMESVDASRSGVVVVHLFYKEKSMPPNILSDGKCFFSFFHFLFIFDFFRVLW